MRFEKYEKTMISTIAIVVFVAVMLLAAVVDVRSRRIPNLLTLTGFGLAMVLRAALGAGWLVDGILGAALALGIMLPLFAMRGVGGGDAKLLVVVGAFLGAKGFLVALAATAVAGGVMSLFVVARRGVLLPVFLNTGGLVKWVFTAGRHGERTTLASPGAVAVPYGVAITIGSLFALYWSGGL